MPLSRDDHAVRRRRRPAAPPLDLRAGQVHDELLRSMEAVSAAAGRALRVLGQDEGPVMPVVELTRWITLVDARPGDPRDLDERVRACLAAVESTGARARREAVAVRRAAADVAVGTMGRAITTLRESAPEQGLVYLIDAAGASDRYTLVGASGANLLAPGLTPADHLRFLFFCGAAVRALPAQVVIDLGPDLEAILDALARGEMFAGSDEERATAGTPALPPVARRAVAPRCSFTGTGFALGRLEPRTLTRVNTLLATAIVEQTQAVEAWLTAGEDREPAVREVVADGYRRYRRRAAPPELSWERAER